MPLYRVTTSPDLLDEPQRRRLAHAITEVHTEVTGAPRSFVHVLYGDPMGQQLSSGPQVIVGGTIRRGRDGEQKAAIETGLRAAAAAIASVDARSVDVNLAEISASRVMEGGMLLPEPGSEEEASWG